MYQYLCSLLVLFLRPAGMLMRRRSQRLGRMLLMLIVIATSLSLSGIPNASASQRDPQQRGSGGGARRVTGVRIYAAHPSPQGTANQPGRVGIRQRLTEQGAAAKEQALRRESRPPTNTAARPKAIVQALGGTSTEQPSPTAPHINAPTFGGSFAGVSDTGQFPPDPTMAAGPNTLVVVTNGAVNIFEKNGTLISTQGLSQFFSALGQVANDGAFDPKVAYDEYIGRFWLFAVSESDTPQRSTFLIGLSDTDDAAGTWTLFSLDARLNGNDNTDNWCDYPQLGIDAQAVYLTCNMFSFPSTDSDSQYAKLRIMTKDQFVNNACCAWWDFWNLREGFLGLSASFTVQPAHMYGAVPDDGEFLINAHGGGGDDDTLEVWHLTHAERCCIPGGTTAPNLDQHDRGVGNFDSPPNARQSGTTTQIDTGDTRLLYAFWKAGLLATGQGLACNDGRDACVAFTELNVASFPSISTVNDWAFQTADVDYYYPAVTVNASGNKTMVYSRSSSSEFAGSSYVGIPVNSACTTCVEGPEISLQAGQNTYVRIDSGDPKKRNRWGDYLGASPDPDGTGIWIHGEFASATANAWATQVGLTYEAIDRSAPLTAASLVPPPNGAGWNNSDVTVTLNANDVGSAGVRRLTYSASGAQTIPPTTVNGASASFTISAEGQTTIFFSARDNWGNQESTRSVSIRIDKGLPGIACGLPDGLWHGSDVSIACTAEDGGSGLATPTDSNFLLSTNVPTGTETADAATGTHIVCDVAGNCATAGPIGGNKVDKKAPDSIIAEPKSITYILKQKVIASYTCTDGGSGLATCTGPVASGSKINTASVGSKTFTVIATDNVGNTASQSVSYIVSYRICLLYDPSKERPSGRTIRIRLQLCDSDGKNVSSSGIVVHALGITPGSLDPSLPLNPGNNFRYHSGLGGRGGGYVYRVRTRGFSPGTYTLTFTAGSDPTVHTAQFVLK